VINLASSISACVNDVIFIYNHHVEKIAKKTVRPLSGFSDRQRLINGAMLAFADGNIRFNFPTPHQTRISTALHNLFVEVVANVQRKARLTQTCSIN
jgi:hypothetical protein